MIRGLTAEQLRFVFRGGTVDLSFDEMRPEVQDVVLKFVRRRTYTVSTSSKDDKESTVLYRYDGARDFRSSRLVVRLSGSPDRTGLFVSIQTGPQSSLTNPNVLYRPAPPPEEQPHWLRDALEKEDAVRRTRGLKAPASEDQDLKALVTIRRLLPIPAGQRSVGAPRVCSLVECLEQLARQIHVPIIAHFDPCFGDYYDRSGLRDLRADLENVTAYEALKRMAANFDVTWDRQEGWIRVWSERTLYAEMDRMDLTPRWAVNRAADPLPTEPR